MKELICITCPRGCHLSVDEENGYTVTGNSCPRGADYGRSELQHPIRVLTSTVAITGAAHRRCPIKTDRPIPREKMMDVMKALGGVQLTAPVTTGQIILKNPAGTDANILVTRDMGGASCGN